MVTVTRLIELETQRYSLMLDRVAKSHRLSFFPLRDAIASVLYINMRLSSESLRRTAIRILRNRC